MRASLGLAAFILLLLPSCEFVDPTAPEGASMSISANPLFIGLGERSTITVIITEEDGTPVPDETVVTFTATLGMIPPRAETQRGVARVELVSGSQVGVATVTARSGTTSNEVSVDVTVGAIVETIALTANPGSLGPSGGSSTITAVVFGDDGEPLANAPIAFSTDAGTLATGGGLLRTGPNGEARDTLSTDQTATVTATSGLVSTTIVVEVTANQPPVAQIAASPTNPGIGQQVTFNAGGSSDPDGAIVAFDWDFGDGDTASGERVTHRYDTANTFSVLLVVTDDQGARASATRTIIVSQGRAPTASFTFSPSNPSAGQTVTFDASSSSDPDGTIVEYRWEWSDGTSPTIRGQGQPTTIHVFGTSGTFTVRLAVRDDVGNRATVTQVVTVK